MRFRNLLFSSLYVAVALCLISALSAAQVRLETAGPLPDTAVAPEIGKAVSTQGYRVLLGGKTLCEIWLATSMARPATAGEHTVYSAMLAPGALAGVVVFPNGAKDFRGQTIRPGMYTLRYALMPNDGNHLGVAPERDFLLLVPAANDRSPATTASAAEVNRASAAASGTNHPATFMLVPPVGGELPRTVETPDGYVVFAAKDLALVVKGQAEQ
jgi:hypothetical protein